MYVWRWLIPIAIVISTIIHLAIASRPFPRGRMIEIILLHLLFWGVGVGSLMEFYSLTFPPLDHRMAVDLGWNAGNFFQRQVGIGLLSLGMLGVSCVWLRSGFWVATVTLSFIMGWMKLGALIFNEVPRSLLEMYMFYDGAGSLCLLILLIVYRLRAGRRHFWDVPTRT